MKVTFKVEGTRQVEAALKELGPVAAGRVARSALNRAATVVVRRAKELVAYDEETHDPEFKHLRDSITKRLRRHRPGSDRQTIYVGVERPRSRLTHLLEFGTARMRPRPFMLPALDQTISEALQIEREVMAAGVDREVRRLAVRGLARASSLGLLDES